MDEIIRKGNVAELEKYFKHTDIIDDDLYEYAAYYGKLDCLQLMSKYYGIPNNEKFTLYATHENKLECLKYLVAQGCAVADLCYVYAARHDYLECLQYLISLKSYGDIDKINNRYNLYAEAGKYDKIKCFSYLHSLNLMYPLETTNYLATRSSIRCFEYIHNNNFHINWQEALYNATINNKINMLEYIHANANVTLNAKTYESMARTDIEILEYLMGKKRHRYCPCIGDNIVQNGCIKRLKYVHELEKDKNVNTWSIKAYINAIANDNIECLEYMVKMRPLEHVNVYVELQRYSFRCFKFAHQNNAICDKSSCNSFDWCEHRCDRCWKIKCPHNHEKETKEYFKS